MPKVVCSVSTTLAAHQHFAEQGVQVGLIHRPQLRALAPAGSAAPMASFAGRFHLGHSRVRCASRTVRAQDRAFQAGQAGQLGGHLHDGGLRGPPPGW